MNRLRSDLATARRRLACLRHVATILTIELVAGLVAPLWGAIVLSPVSTFAASRFAAFHADNEPLWGGYFVVLGIVVLFAALTRSRSTRFVVDIVTCFSVAQMAWRVSQGDEPLAPSPAIYALVGCVLPLAAAGWHFLLLVIDDIAAVPHDVRQAWLDE